MSEAAIAPAPTPIAEIIAGVKAGTHGISVWVVDESDSIPESLVSGCSPRVGRYQGAWNKGQYFGKRFTGPRAKEAFEALLADPELKVKMIEWATAYDGPSTDPDDITVEFPMNNGKLVKFQQAYRGRMFDVGDTDMGDEDSLDCVICDWSMNDVGSCCYLEKSKEGTWDMVIG